LKLTPDVTHKLIQNKLSEGNDFPFYFTLYTFWEEALEFHPKKIRFGCLLDLIKKSQLKTLSSSEGS